MGKYNGAVITTAGQNLIAQAISGGDAVTWTTMQASSYAYPAGTNLEALTALQDVEQTADITSAAVFSSNILQVSARFDNAGVTEPYLINTLGIYAQLGSAAAVLVAVVTAVTPDQMPVEDLESPSAFIYNIQMTIQNADQIAITTNPAGTATVEDMRILEQEKMIYSFEVNGQIISFKNKDGEVLGSFVTQDTTYTANAPISIDGTAIKHDNSGATAGTYGPSANVTGNNNTTINVPQIAVDEKGHVTSIANRVLTNVDTNTWRGIQNNLSSTSTTDSLSAYQGKILADLLNIQSIPIVINSDNGFTGTNMVAYRVGKLVVVSGQMQYNATGTNKTAFSLTGITAKARFWFSTGAYAQASAEGWINANSNTFLMNIPVANVQYKLNFTIAIN